MPPRWISVNKRLMEASTLINTIPLDTFTNILNLLVTQETIITDDLDRINETINFPSEQLQLLIQTILHIYKKAHMVVMNPCTLQKDLERELQIDTDKANAFVKIWTHETKKEFGDMDQRKKLDDVAWSLYLETHSSQNLPGTTIVKPASTVHLSLSDFEKKNTKNVTLNLDTQGLADLYKTMEAIQSKIDNVNALRA